jgi:hypothetical protein
MKIFLAGASEGFLHPLFDAAEASQAAWIVSTGSFGAYPDPQRRGRASRQHGGTDFARMYVGADQRAIRVPVLFISGVHEDHRWLSERRAAGNTEVLANVHHLVQGYRTVIGQHGPPCRVTGLGKVYSEFTYNEQYSKRSHRHYTRRDIEKACSSGPTDLLVLYPHLDDPGIRNVVYAVRAKLILAAKHPKRPVYSEVQGTPVITLGRAESRIVEWNEDSFSIPGLIK